MAVCLSGGFNKLTSPELSVLLLRPNGSGESANCVGQFLLLGSILILLKESLRHLNI